MFTPKYFYPYVIQIGPNTTVLYINYALSVLKAQRDFVQKHPQLKTSRLRPDLYDVSASYKNAKRAHHACLNLTHNLESRGYDVIAGSPIMNRYWSLYVIGIESDENHVYVGETNYPIEKRFQQHVYRFNPSRHLLQVDNIYLREDLIKGLPVYRTKTASLRGEAELAARLTRLGYSVKGGH